MPFYKKFQPGAKSQWRSNLRAAMKRRADSTQCPQCISKNALRRIDTGIGVSVKVCRLNDCEFETSP